MDFRDQFYANLTNPLPALEAARKFFHIYVADADSLDEIRTDLERMAMQNPRSIRDGLKAIEALIADPPAEEGTLKWLVAMDANWALDDSSDIGAINWMREMVSMIRAVLGEHSPDVGRD